MKQRLDTYLVENGLVSGRDLAKSFIMEGKVFVNGQRADKAGEQVSTKDSVELRGGPRYVSRGGLKLEKAMQVFPIDLSCAVSMDIGASTGGFTDCMLQNGAEKVYALDVGHDQLDIKLKNDPRVKNLEGTHIKNLSEDMLDGNSPELVSVDVSFISLEKVLPYIVPFMSEKTDLVCLFKPQFEVGKTNKGIVRREKEMVSALKKFILFLPDFGLGVKVLDFSPIKGPEGNREYLCYMKKGKFDAPIIDAQAVVDIFDANTGAVARFVLQ